MRRWIARLLLGETLEELSHARFVHRELKICNRLRELRAESDKLADKIKRGDAEPIIDKAHRERIWLEVQSLAFGEESGKLLLELFG